MFNVGPETSLESARFVNSLKHFFDRYKTWVLKVLAPLGGPWAIFIIGLMDAAAFGIPLDPIVAYYVHTQPQRALLFIFMGALGGALGSTVPYLLGYKGGEAFVVKKVGRERFQRIHSFTEKYGDLALIVPGIMPPGTPYKLFVFSAGVAEMSYPHFLLAVFTGRVLRFGILAALTIQFGPQIVGFTGVLFKQHLRTTLLVLGSLIALWIIWKVVTSRRKRTVPTSLSQVQ